MEQGLNFLMAHPDTIKNQVCSDVLQSSLFQITNQLGDSLFADQSRILSQSRFYNDYSDVMNFANAGFGCKNVNEVAEALRAIPIYSEIEEIKVKEISSQNAQFGNNMIPQTDVMNKNSRKRSFKAFSSDYEALNSDCVSSKNTNDMSDKESSMCSFPSSDSLNSPISKTIKKQFNQMALNNVSLPN